ncbi:MAG: putative Zn-dependent hydrolase of beta-lactamase fold protein [Planctomycetota bacterium]|nr:putative Zn-dependent hydrolase of beta-lactamase fold protein [Planctomycetota bacterium]
MIDLIRPTLSGPDLLAEIASTRPDPGTLAVWWLGQSGYAIKSRNGLLIIDPYLSEHLTTKYAGTNKPHVRMTEAPCRGHDLAGVDLVLSSHKHSDHMDPGTLPDLMRVNPSATLIVPCSLFDHARSLGIVHDQIIAMEAGDLHAQSGFLVRAIPSAHEELDVDDDGRHLYFGYVIEADGLRLYHSGDTIVYDDLPGWLGADPFDVMFLPINGRDPARGVSGNMTAAEAMDLASQVRPRFVVPHHYDMFTFNTVPISDFEAETARLPARVSAKVLRCGERWIVSKVD